MVCSATLAFVELTSFLLPLSGLYISTEYSGVHASLHSHCHHQILYKKFDLKISYWLTHERTMWDFKHVNSDFIKRATSDIFDWESAINNLDACIGLGVLA